jgi:hypothetical protein
MVACLWLFLRCGSSTCFDLTHAICNNQKKLHMCFIKHHKFMKKKEEITDGLTMPRQEGDLD